MRESALSHRAAQESLPLRDAFSVLFLYRWACCLSPGAGGTAAARAGRGGHHHGGQIAGGIGAGAVVPLPLNTALTVAASLAQIGEFSFILAGLGVALGLLPPWA